jgi:hypothetical protein
VLPKYLFYKIFLALNNVLFNKKLDKPIVVAAKAKGLLSEHIISKIFFFFLCLAFGKVL